MFEERKCLLQLLSKELSFIRKYIIKRISLFDFVYSKKKTHTHKQTMTQTNKHMEQELNSARDMLY